MGDQKHTAVIFDQQPLWLDALGSVLQRIDVGVAGLAVTANEALEAIERTRPDLFLCEAFPEGDHHETGAFIRRARELVSNLKVIVLSSRRDPEAITEALSAGVVAYVVKTAHPDDIASAVRQAFDHSIFFAGTPGHQPVAPAVKAEDIAPGLTRREVEILQLVSEGHSNAQLARMLWVTEQTVKFHLSNIYRKLDVANRTEAARWAQVHGLLDAAPATSVAEPAASVA